MTPERKHILIIDDDDQIRAWLRAVLERSAYSVDEAPDGKAGMNRLQENLPDLVITDLYMPEKEGMELISELHRSYPQVKIIAVSGGSVLVRPFNALTIANHIGAHKILAKPFSMHDLLAAVGELLTESPAS